jgi:hypothetical protein
MEKITVFYIRPKNWIGDMVCWATGDIFSHSILVVGDTFYSSQILRAKKGSFSTGEYKDRRGVKQIIEVNEEQLATIVKFGEGRVGKFYDMLALLGWLFHKRQWNSKSRFYCHEFCREAFELAGLLDDTSELITARRLFRDLQKLHN